MKVGVIGLGWAGRKHSETLAQITAVNELVFTDLKESLALSFAEQYNGKSYPHWEAMLDQEKDLAAVYLCTTTAERAEPIKTFCQRGIPFFCEKPPTQDLATAVELSEIIKRADILHAVGFQYRWFAYAERLKTLVKDRKILFARSLLARPMFKLVEKGEAPAEFLDRKACGGPIVEQASHFIDVLRYITEDEAISVQATEELGKTITLPNRTSPETCIVNLKHRSGMLSTHLVNWVSEETFLELQLIGVDFELTWKIPGGGSLIGRMDGKAVQETLQGDPFVAEVEAFITAIQSNDSNLIRCTFEDATQSLKICLAALEAADTQKEIVIS